MWEVEVWEVATARVLNGTAGIYIPFYNNGSHSKAFPCLPEMRLAVFLVGNEWRKLASNF